MTVITLQQMMLVKNFKNVITPFVQTSPNLNDKNENLKFNKTNIANTINNTMNNNNNITMKTKKEEEKEMMTKTNSNETKHGILQFDKQNDPNDQIPSENIHAPPNITANVNNNENKILSPAQFMKNMIKKNP